MQVAEDGYLSACFGDTVLIALPAALTATCLLVLLVYAAWSRVSTSLPTATVLSKILNTLNTV